MPQDRIERKSMETHEMPSKSSPETQAVLVTTKHRGVFFGYASDSNSAPEKITLTKMRNCIQWRGLKGFLDLTTTGPTSACRVGPAAAEGTLFEITGVWKVEPEAVKAWENSPWAR